MKNNKKILRFNTLDSTNRYLKENIDNLENGAVVVAENQTEGRGRLGKSWLSDDSMLMFSVLVKDSGATLGLTAAVAVLKAFERLYRIIAYVKWPNDIIAKERKVCGILCESRVRRNLSGEKNNIFVNPYIIDIICGIGINVSGSDESFIKNGLPYAGSIEVLYGIKVDKNVLLEEILSHFFSLLKNNFNEIKEYYSKKCLTLDKEILIMNKNSEICAKALGISDEGYLVCEKKDELGKAELFTVNSGEVSVRGLNGYLN